MVKIKTCISRIACYKEQITEWILHQQEDFSVGGRHCAILDEWRYVFDQSPGGQFARLDKVGASSLILPYLYTNLGLYLDAEKVLWA